MPGNGFVEPRFARVRDVFEENFRERGEVGAAFCVYEHGVPVVDLWGGLADPSTNRAWTEDTTAVVYSATKAITATVLLHLIDRGALAIHDRVADHWPEFATAGKGDIRVHDVLAHRAGLPWIDEPVTLASMEAWEPIVESLASQRPAWEPGTRHGYHALSMGWLVGELVRRTSGLTPGQYLRQELAEPFGLDLSIGTTRDQDGRYAPIIPAEGPEPHHDRGYQRYLAELTELADPGADPVTVRQRQAHYSLHVTGKERDAMDLQIAEAVRPKLRTPAQKAFGTVLVTHFDMNLPRLHRLEMPAGNGIGTARALARLYAAVIGTVDGRRMVSQELMTEAARPWSSGPDDVLHSMTAFGLGFMVPGNLYFDAPAEGSFGHRGSGGALGAADPARGLTFGYILNKHLPSPENPRSSALVQATYDCLRD